MGGITRQGLRCGFENSLDKGQFQFRPTCTAVCAVLIVLVCSPRSGVPAQDLRRRKREERLRGTAQRVEEMKRKQRQHEAWQQRRLALRPVILGAAGVGLLIGAALLYKFYTWSTGGVVGGGLETLTPNEAF